MGLGNQISGLGRGLDYRAVSDGGRMALTSDLGRGENSFPGGGYIQEGWDDGCAPDEMRGLWT
jgi:hypothetical protein